MFNPVINSIHSVFSKFTPIIHSINRCNPYLLVNYFSVFTFNIMADNHGKIKFLKNKNLIPKFSYGLQEFTQWAFSSTNRFPTKK